MDPTRLSRKDARRPVEDCVDHYNNVHLNKPGWLHHEISPVG